MKKLIGLLVILLISCNKQKQTTTETGEALTTTDTLPMVQPATETVIPQKYANERFREVTVEKTGKHQYRVMGEGQFFEATFSWVVEDGHNELKNGFVTTDAGAPEWGKFDFTLEIHKKEENSTLMLLLFEASAKDGSRQHELAIALQ